MIIQLQGVAVLLYCFNHKLRELYDDDYHKGIQVLYDIIIAHMETLIHIGKFEEGNL